MTFSETLAQLQVAKTEPGLSAEIPLQTTDQQNPTPPSGPKTGSQDGLSDAIAYHSRATVDQSVSSTDSHLFSHQSLALTVESNSIPSSPTLFAGQYVQHDGRSRLPAEESPEIDLVDLENPPAELNGNHLRAGFSIDIEAFETQVDATTQGPVVRRNEDSLGPTDLPGRFENVPVHNHGQPAETDALAGGQVVLADPLDSRIHLTTSPPINESPGHGVQGRNSVLQAADQSETSGTREWSREPSVSSPGTIPESDTTMQTSDPRLATVDGNTILDRTKATTPEPSGTNRFERPIASAPAVFQQLTATTATGAAEAEPVVENDLRPTRVAAPEATSGETHGGTQVKAGLRDLSVDDRQAGGLNYHNAGNATDDSSEVPVESEADLTERRGDNRKQAIESEGRFVRDQNLASAGFSSGHHLPSGHSITVNESIPIENRNEVDSLYGSRSDGTTDVNLQAGTAEIETVQGRTRTAATSTRFDQAADSGITKQVVDAVQTTRQFQHFKADGISVVKIELDPPELGAVSVEIKRSEEITRVHIVADHVIAHSLLEKDVGHLLASFRENGDYAMEVDVSHREAGQENQERDRQSRNEIHNQDSDASRHDWSKEPAANEVPTTGINMIV